MLVVILRDLARNRVVPSQYHLSLFLNNIFGIGGMWDLQICQVVDNLNDDPAYSSVGVRNQNLSPTKRYQKHQIFLHDTPQKLQVKEDLLWLLKVLMEGIMFCGIVGFPLEIALILRPHHTSTSSFLEISVQEDLQLRSVSPPYLAHAWCDKPFSPGRQIERFLYVGGLEKLSFCHFRLPN